MDNNCGRPLRAGDHSGIRDEIWVRGPGSATRGVKTNQIRSSRRRGLWARLQAGQTPVMTNRWPTGRKPCSRLTASRSLRISSLRNSTIRVALGAVQVVVRRVAVVVLVGAAVGQPELAQEARLDQEPQGPVDRRPADRVARRRAGRRPARRRRSACANRRYGGPGRAGARSASRPGSRGTRGISLPGLGDRTAEPGHRCDVRPRAAFPGRWSRPRPT